MTDTPGGTDFFEEDEPLDHLLRAYEEGEKFVTVSPGVSPTCDHCGRSGLGLDAESMTGPDGEAINLCVPSLPGRVDCHLLVTEFRHTTPCPPCRDAFPTGRPVTVTALPEPGAL